MLRHPSLHPLSHHHQHALALCVRLQRHPPQDAAALAEAQQQVASIFASEIGMHFRLEEELLFPAARRFPELQPLADELEREHSALRAGFAAAQQGRGSAAELGSLAATLRDHVRKEEDVLFEQLQKLLPQDGLQTLGEAIRAGLA